MRYEVIFSLGDLKKIHFFLLPKVTQNLFKKFQILEPAPAARQWNRRCYNTEQDNKEVKY